MSSTNAQQQQRPAASTSASGGGASSGNLIVSVQDEPAEMVDMQSGDHVQQPSVEDDEMMQQRQLEMQEQLQEDEMGYASSSQASSTQTSTQTWINWYTSLPGHDFYCEVHEEYIEDDFNLTGLQSQVPFWKEALEMVLDVEPEEDSLTIPDVSIIETSAELLFGLVHQRFILTKAGLTMMAEKYEQSAFGACPRVYCHSTAVLPCGRSDAPGLDTVKLYCPNCGDLYGPASSKYASVDGAFFGTSFPTLFFQTYPEFLSMPFKAPNTTQEGAGNGSTSSTGSGGSAPPSPLPPPTLSNPNRHGGQRPPLAQTYVPRIYGFRVSERARSGPRMGWLRARPEGPQGLDDVDWKGRWIKPSSAGGGGGDDDDDADDGQQGGGGDSKKSSGLFDDDEEEKDDGEEQSEEEEAEGQQQQRGGGGAGGATIRTHLPANVVATRFLPHASRRLGAGRSGAAETLTASDDSDSNSDFETTESKKTGKSLTMGSKARRRSSLSQTRRERRIGASTSSAAAAPSLSRVVIESSSQQQSQFDDDSRHFTTATARTTTTTTNDEDSASSSSSCIGTPADAGLEEVVDNSPKSNKSNDNNNTIKSSTGIEFRDAMIRDSLSSGWVA